MLYSFLRVVVLSFVALVLCACGGTSSAKKGTANAIVSTTENEQVNEFATQNPHPTPSAFDMSDWDIEGADPRVGEVMEFDALREQHVTPNGSGWRHELKIKSEKRVAMTDVYEDFQANIKVEMSDGSKAIVAQHHAGDTGTIMKLYVSDTSEAGFSANTAGATSDSVASNGIFDVYVRLAREGGGEDKHFLSTIISGQAIDFRVINDHGFVTVSGFGEVFSRTVKDSAKSYLKFGNYLQAQHPQTRENVENSEDWAAFYASQNIIENVITFSDISYQRLVD
ncbi:polysaccharide lyase family 7 protein [Paraglaciecola aquimarina]|uniref:Polysaccharide lyase family 7 protein n=1 Tax=Paraglaciecola aquimarina TaxID=1235557 RepID=A0ABU3SV62_9ALTE|nr:polysaccharide lyase family 7 protein [Paraglaciecola aquimarina]MDU0353873.1 polysaccharide lyase family 7 protein [Paraglaciecola aquimarina]